MGDGIWPDKTLKRCVEVIGDIPGDFAEIGVYRARLFHRVATAAHKRGVHAHAFDSFFGLGGKGKKDGKGFENGALSIGGPQKFVEFMEGYKIPPAWYSMHVGYVPKCFAGADDLRFSLVFIDLDLYAPTVDAIGWAWPRLNPGGVLALDDVFPGRGTFAGLAVDEFLAAHEGQYEEIGLANSQLLLCKT